MIEINGILLEEKNIVLMELRKISILLSYHMIIANVTQKECHFAILSIQVLLYPQSDQTILLFDRF